MLHGSAGAPTARFYSLETARARAEVIACESGSPVIVLEAVARVAPVPRPPQEVVWSEV